ncbi:MAG: large subunit ribosomal protein L4e [Candidatus Woesearchaeota archaeon]|jgi:large subunit ribosomal protein L4e
MKMKVFDIKNTETASIDLPTQFLETVREDLISRAVLAIQSHKRQAYGADPEAGMKHAVDVRRRRRDYKSSYGRGISRIPRKTLSRSGTQFNFVGAEAPGTRGGRQAHPPKAEKIFAQKINTSERKKAIRCALAAVVNKDIVIARGHKVPSTYPFVLNNDFETIGKTSDFVKALAAIGLAEELSRSNAKKIRAGRGTMRNRKYKRPVGPLIVVSDSCAATNAARNIPGVSIVGVSTLNVEDLAPGCAPGRITLFTKPALEKLKELNLFM